MPSSLSLGVGNHCSENVCPDSSFSSLSIYQCVNFHWEWLKWLPNFQTHPYSGGFIHFILWDISLYPSISHPSAGYVRPHIWKAEQRRGGGGLPERLFVTDGWCRILRILKTCWNVCVSFMYIYIILYIYVYIYILHITYTCNLLINAVDLSSFLLVKVLIIAIYKCIWYVEIISTLTKILAIHSFAYSPCAAYTWLMTASRLLPKFSSSELELAPSSMFQVFYLGAPNSVFFQTIVVEGTIFVYRCGGKKYIYTMDVTTIHNIKPSRWPCGVDSPNRRCRVQLKKISLQVPFVKGLFVKRMGMGVKNRGITWQCYCNGDPNR